MSAGFGTRSAYGDGELEFEQEERLPWLTSDDDMAEKERVDSGRLIGLGLLAIVLLAVLLGGLWWLVNGRGAGGPIPDGSIIEAPEGPYKTKPDDPGGKTFDGTGDTSFIVGEGETREGRLADETPLAEPAEVPDGAASNEAEAAENAAPPRLDGVGVQVGAYFSPARAEEGWRTLTRQTEVLNGVRHRVVQGQADIGTVFRLQAVASSMAEADALCEALKNDGLACQVKR